MRVLVTGASGLLGNALVRQLAASGTEVAALSFRTPVTLPAGVFPLTHNLEEPGLEALVAAIQPEAIVNAAALSEPGYCEREPMQSRAMNTDLPGQLAELCQQNNARLIHFSTDMVFDGQEGDYDEESITNPKSTYGQHKLEGENRCLDACSRAIVIRLPLLMGNSPTGQRSIHEALFRRWSRDKSTPLFEDEIRQPVSVSNVSLLVENILRYHDDLAGRFHWAGAESLNRLEMGKRIAAHFGIDESLLEATRAQDLPNFKDRPLKLTMNCTKLAVSVDVPQPSFDEQLATLKQPEAAE